MGQERVQCRECGREMNSEEELREHIKNGHKDQAQQSGEKTRTAGGGTGQRTA